MSNRIHLSLRDQLALITQARLLRVARSTVYREPLPVPASDLAVMRRIDELLRQLGQRFVTFDRRKRHRHLEGR